MVSSLAKELFKSKVLLFFDKNIFARLFNDLLADKSTAI